MHSFDSFSPINTPSSNTPRVSDTLDFPTAFDAGSSAFMPTVARNDAEFGSLFPDTDGFQMLSTSDGSEIPMMKAVSDSKLSVMHTYD